MFRVPRVNVIESDEGFSVEVLGRTGLLYTEGERYLRVDSEMLASDYPFAMMVIKASIQSWAGPHFGEMIDEATRDRIVNNIREAFRSQGEEIEVV
jgi:hypothetical protein